MIKLYTTTNYKCPPRQTIQQLTSSRFPKMPYRCVRSKQEKSYYRRSSILVRWTIPTVCCNHLQVYMNTKYCKGLLCNKNYIRCYISTCQGLLRLESEAHRGAEQGQKSKVTSFGLQMEAEKFRSY